MKKTILRVLLAILICLSATSFVVAETIWDYEAVNADGTGSYPLVSASDYDGSGNPILSNKVTIQGIALAGMNDLWSAGAYGQYVLLVQDDTSDRGGMEIWAGSYWWATGWRPTQYAAFGAGDRVQVTGFLQDHNGKVFINDDHGTNLNYIPVVTVLGHPGLPDPELIPSIASCNYFDQTRNDGGERYQTRLAMLHGVQIDSGTWASGQALTISDATGTGTLYIPPMVSVTGAAPTGKISIVGIYDQEQTSATNLGYRMILRNTSDVAIALDACREVRSRTSGDKVALAKKTVSRAYSGYFFIQDADRSGGVKVVSNHPVTSGDVVSIMGTVSTEDGENVLTATYVVKSRNGAGPLYVNGQTLSGQTGLDVFGMLIRCVGHIGSSLGNGLYQFTTDNNAVITLNSNGYAVPAQGSLVTVTAVASGNSSAPVLLLGSANDIQPVSQ